MSRYVMTAAEKDARRDRVLDLGTRGVHPRMIATECGLTTNYVRNVLRSHAVDFAKLSSGMEVDRVWSVGEDQRRLAFQRRAAAGARATRLAMGE